MKKLGIILTSGVFWAVLVLFIVDEVTPFFAILDLAVLIGLFYTPLLRWFMKILNDYLIMVDGIGFSNGQNGQEKEKEKKA